MLPLSTNIREAYKNGQEDEQNFIQNLALFLCTFLKEHAVLIEQKPELQNNLLEVCFALASEIHVHICRILTLSPSHSGPPLSSGNLRGGGKGDLQNLSRVLEPLGC